MATKGYKAIPITARSKKSVGCSSAPLKQTTKKPKEKSFANKAGHLALDVLGFVDVWGIGTGADLINASWYASEGDKTNAALSTAAAIPLAGWAAGATKLGLKGTKAMKVSKAIDKGAANYRNTKLVKSKAGKLLELKNPQKLGKIDRVAEQVLFGTDGEKDK